jgi:hypothetical protein
MKPGKRRQAKSSQAKPSQLLDLAAADALACTGPRNTQIEIN